MVQVRMAAEKTKEVGESKGKEQEAMKRLTYKGKNGTNANLQLEENAWLLITNKKETTWEC